MWQQRWISFVPSFDQALIDQSKVERDSPDYQQWTLDIGRWLYSVDHIQVSFSLSMPTSLLVSCHLEVGELSCCFSIGAGP